MKTDLLLQRLEDFLNMTREAAGDGETNGVANTIEYIKILERLGICRE